MQFASSTYYAAKSRELSARALRDAMLLPILMKLWVDNKKVYGARKLWIVARRNNIDVGRDQVGRLMRQAGIYGTTRRRRVFTTVADPDATRASDLVKRDFTALGPNQLWVTDLTYVPTRSGMAYVCFIIDAYSRRIVGWRAASHMRTGMVLDAVDMARRIRSTNLEGLIAHSDAGSQFTSLAFTSLAFTSLAFTSLAFTDRLAEIGARPSIGTVADSYDNALAQTING